jgi:hypothetical protein
MIRFGLWKKVSAEKTLKKDCDKFGGVVEGLVLLQPETRETRNCGIVLAKIGKIKEAKEVWFIYKEVH